MKRIVENQLLEWKQKKRRKPLLVRGARQIGKTWSVQQFGEKNFKNVLVIDFEKKPEFASLFNKDLDAKRIVADIELMIGKAITPGETLLFFDEIQNTPKAIAALRYFFEDFPGLHVIAAGSLLDFALKEISFPVGRVQFLEMFPLTFPEFLYALGKREAANLILGQPQKVSESVHEMLLDHLRMFFLTGGFPEAVLAYKDTHSFMASFEIQRELFHAYMLDFSKYAPRADKRCLHNVLENAAKNVGAQTKYSRLSEGFSNPTIKKAFEVLALAGVLTRVTATSGAGLPLGANASDKIFKTLLVDIGMMGPLNALHQDTLFSSHQLLSVYRGALAEQFVGQEFLAGSQERMFYWANSSRGGTAEIDYLLQKNSQLFPIEVKSAAAGSLKSMHLFLNRFPMCAKGLVLSLREYQALPEQSLEFVPLYYAFSLASKSPVQLAE